MKSTKSATKVVAILATYVFAHINRVCFTVLSSDGVTRYNTCFTNGHGSCDCPARGECYHLRQLAPIAAEKLEKRNAVAAAQAIVSKPVDEEYEQWKRENGKSDRMSRDEYIQEYAIY